MIRFNKLQSPFTKDALGNVCTEDFVHALQRMGFRTEINLLKLIGLAKEFSVFFNREMPGLVHKTR
jgi:hydroxymethylglutaryl-CoA lyase